ncbi:exosome complex protein Rrp42 [Candidatus Woesearchaeota archaeon]|nr:exosome complex protein Rrp42 [Candidatus Woesearchaeota archaeon]
MNKAKHIINYLSKDLRFDGRKLNDYRDIVIETGIAETAEGTARVKIGDTELIAGVKMSIEKPYPDTPNKGVFMVGAELLPLSSQDFEPGPPSSWAIEVARVVDRGIRESGALDVSKLVISNDEQVWGVLVDICTINDNGNILDAASLAVMAALLDTKFPAFEDGSVDYKNKTKDGLPLTEKVIANTVYKLEDYLITDPTAEEEKLVSARLTVCFTEKGEICALQKGGNDALSKEEIVEMTRLAKENDKVLRKHLG